MIKFFRHYLLAGFVFQSVIIAGGYATGRELVEFFLSYGPVPGLLAMLVATACISIIMPVGFEFARMFRAYDYYSFTKALLGRFWILFELGYATGVILVLAVIAAGVGAVASERLGVSSNTASLVFMLLVGFIVYFGSSLIERVLSIWSLLLYLAYGTMFYLVLTQFGDNIAKNISVGGDTVAAVKSGVLYSALQFSMIPAVLFAARNFEARKHAIISGLLAGPIAIIPAFLMFFSMLAFYPAITFEPVPMARILDNIGASVLSSLIQLVILGTFVETGVAIIHSINERVAVVMREHNREIRPMMRTFLGFGVMMFSVYLATAIGIVDLIGKGYMVLAYYFVLVLGVPLFTIGLKKVIQNKPTASQADSQEQ